MKCDIRNFFANIDHEILLNILGKHIQDKDILWLLGKIINSFETRPGASLPLGNLTSQLFVNIYMNEFDQFMKHKVKAKDYIRYADDFVVFSGDKKWLENQLELITKFLSHNLKLELHPNKVFIKSLTSGVDFLGWINFLDHRILRTSTKRRMIKNMENGQNQAKADSYLGLLRYGNTRKLKKEFFNR